MLSVIVFIFWWQHLIDRNLENQYQFFVRQISEGHISNAMRELIEKQDNRLADKIFVSKTSNAVWPNATQFVEERLQSRRQMVFYEQSFFIILLLAVHIYLLYVYFREHRRRKIIEQAILLATHELRQPLQSLSLAVEAIYPKAREKTQGAVLSGLNDIHRLGELVRYLAGAFNPKTNTGSLVIKNLEEHLTTLLNIDFEKTKKRIQLRVNSRSIFKLRIGEEKLHFILRNLIENALKYTQGKIQVTATNESNCFTFCVTNSGEAMDKASFKRIGNAFYRATSADVQNKTGFGLGLHLCGYIARRSGGKLTLENSTDGITRTILKLRSYP